MSSRKLAALAAACALAASGLSVAADYGGGDSGGQSGAPQLRSEVGATEGGTGGSIESTAIDSGTNGTSAANDHPHAYGDAGAPNETGIIQNERSTAYQEPSTTGSTETIGADTGSSLLAQGTGVSHQALLAGGNEVSSDGKADAGDPDGNGAASISIDPEAGKLCFAIVVNNLDTPVAAHIHQAAAGQNGPVVVTLAAPDRGDPGTSSGCIDNVDRLLLQAMHAHPWAFYVNVHSGAYPDGAARGQLY